MGINLEQDEWYRGGGERGGGERGEEGILQVLGIPRCCVMASVVRITGKLWLLLTEFNENGATARKWCLRRCHNCAWESWCKIIEEEIARKV